MQNRRFGLLVHLPGRNRCVEVLIGVSSRGSDGAVGAAMGCTAGPGRAENLSALVPMI